MRRHSQRKSQWSQWFAVGAASALIAGAYLACNSSADGHHPLPCSTLGDPKCGSPCKIDADCGLGLHCGGDNTCQAECTPTGNQCGANEACDPLGRCIAATLDAAIPIPKICPAGAMCDVPCTNGATTTTISGKVYDPAGKNGLYGVSVYVPEVPLVALPRGVPAGSDACSCSALYASGATVSTSTAEDGSFTLSNAPVGASVPLVIQVGKWRRQFNLNITSCQDNPQADKSLAFPSTVAAGEVNNSIPDIAVSTGSADTLECLMRRIGIASSEYVAGSATTGHIHVFSGGKSGGGGGGGIGKPENPIMPGAPASSTNLWMSQAQLMPYDIVLLSCEGGETYNANPPALEAYLNGGGRVFASHFHYAWFSGPIDTTQTYTAPADWGTHLATWAGGGGGNNGVIGGTLDTTLNGTATPFPKGVALQKWLTNTSALGKNTVPAGELSIYQPRFNATVASTNTASQAWITADATSGNPGATMYFSFDTPVNAAVDPDLGAPAYCGRAVFSDLHVAGDPLTNDNPPPPGGCANTDLSPQEKALEFMLFDLSSCVIPDTAVPPMGVPIK